MTVGNETNGIRTRPRRELSSQQDGEGGFVESGADGPSGNALMHVIARRSD